jgi:hypothetical protein
MPTSSDGALTLNDRGLAFGNEGMGELARCPER